MDSLHSRNQKDKTTKFTPKEMNDQMNTIIEGDFLEIVKRFPDNSFDLIIADPPYNLGKNFGTEKIWDDFRTWLDWCKTWIVECRRVLKPTGSIFIYGIHHYLCFIQVFLYEIGLKYRRQIIWHYENAFSTYTRSPRALYESIIWFSKSDEYTYNMIREPYKSQERLKNKIIKNGKVWKPNPEGRHGGDVWNIPILAGKRFAKEKTNHPTQKPLALCRKIVKHFSNRGNLILVPFTGSGSECIACKIENRMFIATELNPQYVRLAERRINSMLI